MLQGSQAAQLGALAHRFAARWPGGGPLCWGCRWGIVDWQGRAGVDRKASVATATEADSLAVDIRLFEVAACGSEHANWTIWAVGSFKHRQEEVQRPAAARLVFLLVLLLRPLP
jgi:hypothetical protein